MLHHLKFRMNPYRSGPDPNLIISYSAGWLEGLLPTQPLETAQQIAPRLDVGWMDELKDKWRWYDDIDSHTPNLNVLICSDVC